MSAPALARAAAIPAPLPVSVPRFRSLCPSAALAALLVHWHLLSLDAPTVAALWALLIARCAGVRLPFSASAAMFVAVWILYVSDRLLDAHAASLPPGQSTARTYRPAHGSPGEAFSTENPLLEERHFFHAAHRRDFSVGLAAGAVLLIALLPGLDPAALRLYGLLGGLLLGWFLLIHLRPGLRTWFRIWPRRAPGDTHSKREPRRLPKELAVGVFFPAAIFIPGVARVPALRAWLLPDALMLACVCTLNCLYIYAWEHPVDRTSAHASTRWAVDRLPRLSTAAITLALLALLAALRVWRIHGLQAPQLLAGPALACALSLLALRMLDLYRDRLRPVLLRAAADAALLTPALLLPWVTRVHLHP